MVKLEHCAMSLILASPHYYSLQLLFDWSVQEVTRAYGRYAGEEPLGTADVRD